ncbi:extracellular solute-binding protein [Lacrimispora sp.]|uniref:ABC transporter substrate-binding protein n=1 Tax=Lacrimispora sp. TaxID=2719234 RepID=UPI0032E3C852
MKGKRGIAFLLVAATVISGVIGGCTGKKGLQESESETEQTKSQSGGSKEGVTEVSFWTLNTRQNAVESIAEAFNAANKDIKVTVSYYDTDGIKDACKVAASSGTLPNMWFNWGGSLGGFYAENGLSYDLTEYAKNNGWADRFSSGVLNLCQLSGQLSGYPTSYNVLDVYYRKDIFEKYGIKVPATFEEFETACAKLKENGITPISTAGLNGWHVMRFVELLIEHYAGSELHDSLNTFSTSYNCEAVISALTKYKEFCEKGYFPEGFVTTDPNDTKMALFSGSAAMDIQGQWYDGVIVQDEQDMNLYGTFAFPSGGSDRLSAFAEMTQFNAKNTDTQLDACMKFMDYYYNEENVKKYAEYYNLPLPNKEAKMPEGQPNVADMLAAAEANGTFTITDQAFPTEVADALFNVQDAIANGQMEPADGASKIQEAIEAYRAK